jgi:hypothetical protein
MLLKVVIIDYVMRNRRSNNELDRIGAGLAINSLIQEGKLNANEATNMLDEMYVIGIDCYEPNNIDNISMFFDSLRYTIEMDKSKTLLDKVETEYPIYSMVRHKNHKVGDIIYYVMNHFINGKGVVYTRFINPGGTEYDKHLSMESYKLFNTFDIITEEDISIYDKTYMIGKFVDSLGMVLDCLPKDKYDSK